MSIIDRMLGTIETRASFSEANPRDPIVAEWFAGRSNTAAGISVNAETSLKISAVSACVRILSSTLAALPLDVYRRLDRGRERAADHSLYRTLHTQPNPWQTSFEWREMQQAALLLRGNSYDRIVSSPQQAVAALIPLHPDMVNPMRGQDGNLIYEYTPPDGPKEILLSDEVHHKRGLTIDGIKGISPIDYQRETLGLTLAAEKFGASYFGNGTVLGGVLESDQALSPEARNNVRDSWIQRFQGSDKSHGIAVLEQGLKWRPLGVAPEQAQFLETRAFQISEIARIFGVPPHMLADIEKTTSWGTGIEQQGIGFVVYSLMPWLKRWEQAIQRDLFSPSDQQTYFAEFNVDGLLRGDAKSRAEYYSKGILDGWLVRNEVRQKENLNPIDGLDEPLQPLNMAPVTEEAPEISEDTDPADSESMQNDSDQSRQLLEKLHGQQIEQALDRIVTCEVKALRRALNASKELPESFDEKAGAFYANHKAFIIRHLNPLLGDKFCKQYASDHLIASVTELKDCIDADGLQAASELLDRWEVSRAIELAADLADKALEEYRHAVAST